MTDDIVFLLDVDNTLLDNDRFTADLSARLVRGFGTAGRDRYWAHFARLRDELGYADYLGALQACRTGLEEHPDLLQMSSFLLDYPFTQLLYPRALETIAYLRTLGLTVVMSDGDVVFQPRKVQRSGIWDAVEGRVLIQPHKQHALDGMQRRYPAAQYAMVDDKRGLLAAMKQVLGTRLTTIFVRQGHYAIESADMAIYSAADISIDCISGLIGFDRAHFAAAAPVGAATPTRSTSLPEHV
jgi:FMN phosphatase YigB (HAD superfamily)